MPAAPDTLPDDIEALKALLRQRDGELQQLRDTVSTLEQALSVRSLEIEQLKLQLAKLRRMQFGRKSEKLDRQIEQLETRLEDLLAEDSEHPVDAAVSEPTPTTPRPARQPLPAHLPPARAGAGSPLQPGPGGPAQPPRAARPVWCCATP